MTISIKPSPQPSGLDMADYGFMDSVFFGNRSLGLTFTDLVSDFSYRVDAQLAGGFPFSISIPHVLNVISEVEVPDVQAPFLTLTTGVKNKEISGISMSKSPQGSCTGHTHSVDLCVGNRSRVTQRVGAIVSRFKKEFSEELKSFTGKSSSWIRIIEILTSVKAMFVHRAEALSVMWLPTPFNSAAPFGNGVTSHD